MQEGVDGPIKIGLSNDLRARMSGLQVGNSRELRLIGSVHCADARIRESEIHGRIWGSRIRGEWFWPTSEVLAYIAELCPNHEVLVEPEPPPPGDPPDIERLEALRERLALAWDRGVA